MQVGFLGAPDLTAGCGGDTAKSEGEGSRGGKVIGHTSSGKPVYESHGHAGHAGFSRDDHRDAMAIHAYLHSKGRDGSEAEGKKHEASTVRTSGPLAGKVMQKFGEERSAVHGKTLVAPDLRKSEGEGSRGGKVIGHTKSGKPVYESGYKHPSVKGFSKQDHVDADKIHSAVGGNHFEDYVNDAEIANGENREVSAGAEEAHKKADHHAEQAVLHSLKAKSLQKALTPDRYVIEADVEKALSSGSAPKRHFGMAPPPAAHESVSVRGHGEGSRGGMVIGHTKTMKPIYQDSSHSSHATFSAADHNDAVEAHKAKIWEAIRKRDSETTPEGRAYHASKIEYHKGARDYHRGRAERAKGELQ